ncbi:MAG: prepilin peptidase, partial [Patescibacteria group bacterium]
IAGSFANVVVMRLNTGMSIGGGRSKCFSCGRALTWPELVPLISFLVQQGRCRACRSKISLQYPLVELLMGILFALLYLKWRADYGAREDIYILAYWCLAGFLLVVLSAYDARHKILPDKLSYAFLTLALAGNFLFIASSAKELVLSLLPSFFIFLLWITSRGRWMGLGDAKLMAGGGLFLGWPDALWALLAAFWTGAAFGILLMIAERDGNLKREIPFGPFVSAGILIAFFFPGMLNSLLLFYE